MPGIIQVTVLDFQGVKSSTSSLSIKVSMGKREYQTCDEGDFSFPLTNLRENLIVTLYGAEENLISCINVQIKSVIEKGLWEDIYYFEGGGYVRMKMQFILSEEERNRVRSVRESAIKKKELQNVKLKHLETTNLTDGSFASSSIVNQQFVDSRTNLLPIKTASSEYVTTKSGLTPNPASLLKNSFSDVQNTTTIGLADRSPNAMDSSEETPLTSMTRKVEIDSSKLHHKPKDGKVGIPVNSSKAPHDACIVQPFRDKFLTQSKCSESDVMPTSSSVEQVSDVTYKRHEKQGPLEKTPSNIRELITAFESNPAQATRPLIEQKKARSQIKKNDRQAVTKDREIEDDSKESEPKSQRRTHLSLAKNVEQTQTNATVGGDNIGFNKDTVGRRTSQKSWQLESIPLESSSGEHLGIANITNVADGESNKRKQNMSLNSLLKPTASGKDPVKRRISELEKQYSFSKQQRDYDVISVQKKMDSVVYCEYDQFSFGSSSTSVFLRSTRRLCITTARKKVLDLLGGWRIEAKHREDKSSFSSQNVQRQIVPAETDEVKNGEKKSHTLGHSKPESSPANASNGPVGQAIKFAVIVGFGVLILLTRQKEPRNEDRKQMPFSSSSLKFEQGKGWRWSKEREDY